MNTIREFKSVAELVSHVLEHYPDTRSSDNRLYIKCAQIKGAKTLSDLDKIGLNLITIHKQRQKLNREGLYLPSADVLEVRSQRAKEVKQYMIS